jgi:protein gp37
MAGRLKAMGQARYQRDGNPQTSGPGFAVTLHHELLDAPRRWRKPRLVFVNSMSDLFHPDVPDEFIGSVFDTMAACPQHTFQVLTKRSKRLAALAGSLPWPDNVWMGVTVESAAYTFRVNHLRQVPAAVRFLSVEPLVAPVGELDLAGVGWVIVGGESGPGARVTEPSWVRSVRDECVVAGVPFFFKQWGGLTPKSHGRLLDGQVWDELPSGGR